MEDNDLSGDTGEVVELASGEETVEAGSPPTEDRQPEETG